jgi:predicted secreted protein
MGPLGSQVRILMRMNGNRLRAILVVFLLTRWFVAHQILTVPERTSYTEHDVALGFFCKEGAPSVSQNHDLAMYCAVEA